MASRGSIFAYLIIWCSQEKFMEGGEKSGTAKVVAMHGVLFGGTGSKNVCDAGSTLWSSPQSLSQAYSLRTVISHVWITPIHCIPKDDNLETCNSGIGEEVTSNTIKNLRKSSFILLKSIITKETRLKDMENSEQFKQMPNCTNPGTTL